MEKEKLQNQGEISTLKEEKIIKRKRKIRK